MDFTNPESVLNLDNIRQSLVRMEETIVFNLIERAQFYTTPSAYKPKAFPIPDFDGSFLDWFLLESERTHSKVRRYEAPDEVPFFPNQLCDAILPKMELPRVLASYHKEVNVNNRIKDYYISTIVPLVAAGDGDQPENVGSCAVCDVETLQALSRRIHFGKFVAESKYQKERERFDALIKDQDADGIDAAITNAAVEEQILERLRAKAQTYGVDPTLRWSQKAQGTIDPEAVVRIYKECVIPLTKVVEVDYLLRRHEDS
jgi:chorismate mutase